MTKIGKTMNSVTEEVVKAGGVVTKCGGEMIGEIGKKVGVSDKVCNKVTDKSSIMGKDIYYASRKIGHNVENVTEDLVDSTKKMAKCVRNKIK